MDVPDAIGQTQSSRSVFQGNVRHDTLQTSDGTSEKDKIQGRLNTYTGWSGLVLPIQLAVAGFIYTGQGDTVLCTFCNLIFYNWSRELKPLDIHRKFSPSCSFLKRWFPVAPEEKARQAETEARSNSYDASRAKFPDFVEFIRRRSSFVGWPHKGEDQSPQNMAIAGFFYLGSSDRCKCFYCGLILRDWDTDDIPVAAHKQWSPNCAYIQHIAQGQLNRSVSVQNQGRSAPQVSYAPRAASALETTSLTTLNRTGSFPMMPTATLTSLSSSNETKFSSKPSSSFSTAASRQNSQVPLATASTSNPDLKQPRVPVLTNPGSKWTHPPMVQALLDWGFQLDDIQRGMRRHKETSGRDVQNAAELLSILDGYK